MIFHYDVSSLLQLLLVTITVLHVRTAHPNLKLVSIVFRHGDRTPDNNGLEMYPNDPYLNCSFYPIGLGGLTNEGKRREYRLGQILRLRYGKFLGSIYVPWEIEARSTDYERTKMSLQLVLSALYPPDTIQKWNNDLPWQPIPMTYKPAVEDVLLIPEECPKYVAEYNRVKNSPDVLEKLSKFNSLMEFVEEKTGRRIKDSNDLYYLYHTLMAEKSMNLTIPDWTENIFPKGEILDAINLEYDILSYNRLLKRLNGGMLVRKISEDMRSRMNDSLQKGKKLYLYSGHETNIVAFQQSLGVYKPHAPEYSSAVIVELLHMLGEYFVRVLYYTGIPSQIIVQKVPGCSELCPYEKFLNLMKDVIPSDEELVCVKSPPPQRVMDNIMNIIKQKDWVR